MKALCIIIGFLLVQVASGQGQYEKAMDEAMQLWQSGKMEEAMARFERIARAEKEQWLPAYYEALVGITTSFQRSDAEAKMQLIRKANAVIAEHETKGEVSEWLVLKALALTSELTIDPMSNAMRLSPQITSLYERAIKENPANPRARYGLADFSIQTKKYTGGNTQKECEDLQKALSLFEQQHQEERFYPSWGKDRVEQILQQCQQR